MCMCIFWKSKVLCSSIKRKASILQNHNTVILINTFSIFFVRAQVLMLSHANCQVVHRCKRMPVYAINAQHTGRARFTFPIYKWDVFYSLLPTRAAGAPGYTS